jgi:hypothetical protein
VAGEADENQVGNRVRTTQSTWQTMVDRTVRESCLVAADIRPALLAGIVCSLADKIP